MRVFEDLCCDCAVPGYPCRGSACPLRRVEVVYCDICGEETDDYVEYEDRDICSRCLEEDEEDEESEDDE